MEIHLGMGTGQCQRGAAIVLTSCSTLCVLRSIPSTKDCVRKPLAVLRSPRSSPGAVIRASWAMPAKPPFTWLLDVLKRKIIVLSVKYWGSNEEYFPSAGEKSLCEFQADSREGSKGLDFHARSHPSSVPWEGQE